MIDFEAVKKIPIEKVCERFGIKLSGTGKWRYADCPLPSHDPAKLKTKFGVNTAKNYFSCFSASCREKRGGAEFGDVITLVQFLEGCGAKDAAEKLAGWYLKPDDSIDKRLSSKTQKPQQEAEVSARTETTSPNNHTTESGKGYMAEVDAWFDKLIIRNLKETEPEFWKRVRNSVKAKLIESYKSGLAKSAA